MIWNLEEMKKLASSICDSDMFRISSLRAGGDCDTEYVYVSFKDKGFRFCAFNTNGEYFGNERNNVEADAIELNTDINCEPLEIVAIRIRKKLRDQGWIVVPNLRDYF